MDKTDATAPSRELILQAAYEVFLEKGMEGAGTQQIANRAEVNKAMLYYYFDSKENLFVEVYRRAIEESGIKSIKIMEEEAPLFDKIRKYIDLFTDRLIEQPQVCSFVMNELNRHPKLLKDILAGEMKFDSSGLSKQLSEAADRYDIARVDVSQLLANIMTLCMGPAMNSPYYSVILEFNGDAGHAGFLRERKGVIYDMLISWLTG